MNADRIAPWYRWIEYAAFGRALEHHRFLFLDRVANARRILLMGEGDGRTLARLLNLAPNADIDVVESSARMIEIASRRIAASTNVRFHHGDATRHTFTGPYDAIITSFFLDCFDEPAVRVLVQRLAQSLTPGGLWLMNDFAIPLSGWRHWHARAWISIMYRFFRLTTGLQANRLPPIENLLTEAGFRLLKTQSSRAGMIVSQVWTRH